MHIPDPLHPAVVHFPIVLILLATLTTILSFFFRKDILQKIAVILFILASVAAYIAEDTGGDAYSPLKKAYPHAVPMLKHHANLANITFNVTCAASFFGLLAIFIEKRNSKLFHLFKGIFILAALTSSYYVYETAKFGGEMIYGSILHLSHSNLEDTLKKEN